MLENHKVRELECLVLGGFCPNCQSADIQYREYERNQKFSFKCFRCFWTGRYTSEDLTQASTHWSGSPPEEETTEL